MKFYVSRQSFEPTRPITSPLTRNTLGQQAHGASDMSNSMAAQVQRVVRGNVQKRLLCILEFFRSYSSFQPKNILNPSPF